MAAAGIRLGIKAGAFRVTDPELAASFIHHPVDGTVRDVILCGRQIERDRLLAVAKELSRKLLR
jgi:hypothetical protein